MMALLVSPFRLGDALFPLLRQEPKKKKKKKKSKAGGGFSHGPPRVARFHAVALEPPVAFAVQAMKPG